MIDIVTKAKNLFLPSPLELDGKKEVLRKSCLNCMRLTTDLQKKLPLNSFFVNCCYIHLQKKNDNALKSITCIAQDITKALSQVLFDVCSKNTSPEEVCDAFRSERRLYQTEKIKEEHCCCTAAAISGRKLGKCFFLCWVGKHIWEQCSTQIWHWKSCASYRKSSRFQ